jgi:hypothetical protein
VATFVDTTVQQIEARLSELTEEVSRLEAARAALAGSGASPARRRRRRGRPRKKAATAAQAAPVGEAAKPAAARRKPARPRGRRAGGGRAGGGRASEALALVKAQPGVTIPQLAAAMKIQPNYLYRVLPKLAAAGEIKRDGKGWHPVS